MNVTRDGALLLALYCLHIFLFSCRQLSFSLLYPFPGATMTNSKPGDLK